MNALSTQINQIVDGLPWDDRKRLIVGPLASRETVKDHLLAISPNKIIPHWCVQTFEDLASQILSEAGLMIPSPLGVLDKKDALIRLSKSELLKSKMPRLSSFISDRRVATKVAAFISAVDRHYVTDIELDAITEYLKERGYESAEFMVVLRELWKRGVLYPWSGSEKIRQAILILNKGLCKYSSGKTFVLWGFEKFTDLETQFIKSLETNSAKVEILDEVKEPTPKFEFWRPHTVSDELGFLYDDLKKSFNAGLKPNEIGLFVPEDVTYKRYLRSKLKEWRVPLQDPTLSDGENDVNEWIWWKDWLSMLMEGMKTVQLLTVLKGTSSEQLNKLIYEKRISGTPAQWKKFLAGNDDPFIRFSLDAYVQLSKSMKVTEFKNVLHKIADNAEKLSLPANEILIKFADHLGNDRPYLKEFHFRLNKIVPLFQEYLSFASRSQSIRSKDGVLLLSHGVWLPFRLKRAYILDSGSIEKIQPSYDPWDWEGIAAERLIKNLHGEDGKLSTICELHSKIQRVGLLSHDTVIVSATSYDRASRPRPIGNFYKSCFEKNNDSVCTFEGGHLMTGWRNKTSEIASPHFSRHDPSKKVLSPDLLSRFINDKNEFSISVSNLERYIECPYRFYMSKLLELEREESLELTPNGAVRGEILHKVFEIMIRNDITKERPFPLDKEIALRYGSEVLECVVEKSEFKGMFRSEQLKASAIVEFKARLKLWIEWEIATRLGFPEVKPLSVEEYLDTTITLKSGRTIKIKGKVDRVDVLGDGFLVVDYKLMSQAPFIGKELLSGQGVQLLAYVLAMKNKFKRTPIGAYYLTVAKTVSNKKGIFLKQFNKKAYDINGRNSGLTDQSFDEILDSALMFWEERFEKLLLGDFTPNPVKPTAVCETGTRTCEYYGKCGFDYKLNEKITEDIP